jgi:hypothetical protein
MTRPHAGEWRMANGEWRMKAWRGLVLQRSDQRTKHFAQTFALRQNALQIGGRQDAYTFRQ